MPKKPDVVALLAEQLLRQLAVQRGLGDYPLTVQRLAELTDPNAAAADVLKAVAKKPFTERLVVARMKSLAAPIALVEDTQQLAASELLLEFVLDLACTPAKPIASVIGLKTKVEMPLREPFVAALAERIRASTLPPSIEVLRVRSKEHLHPLKFPLPVPPEIGLAKDLVRVLEAQKQLGDRAYPMSLARLKELTAPKATQVLLSKAVKTSPFRELVGDLPSGLQVLVALRADRESLVRVPGIVEILLKTIRTKDNHVVTATDLVKAVATDLKSAFSDVIKQQLDANTLPASLGWIKAGKKKLLFLWEDVQGTRPRAPARVSEALTSFVARFDEAFDRLNRARGSHNFVSLVELRRELPFARDAFDQELRQLRIAGRYSLSGAEGRHGLSPEERDAGIPEDGTLLLYVSRRSP